MTARRDRLRSWWAAALFVLLATSTPFAADDPAKAKGQKAIGPVAPELPGGVVALIQEGKYADAITSLDRLIAGAKSASDRSYFRFLRGISERLGGNAVEARKTLAEALEAEPKGPWASKIRFELAAVELAAGHPAEAETLARIEAETLLSPERKDRLAEVYHAFARRLLKPEDPVSKPDPVSAYALLAKARELAKGEKLRGALLFEMARAAQATIGGPNSQAGLAIRDFQAYIHDYPRTSELDAARFHLGEVQLLAGQNVAARMTWTDLARPLDFNAAKRTQEQLRFMMLALSKIPATYGIPNPPDDTSLNLGVASLRRFLAADPASPKAPRASFEIGASYQARNRSEEAIAAYRSFLKGEGFQVATDEARRDVAELSMSATSAVASILANQRKFEESIAEFQVYLTRYPNGPNAASSQLLILYLQLEIAGEALSEKKFDQARATWEKFVAQNPLDSRVPQVLFEVGQSFATEKKFDQAITAWDALIGRFPGSEPASHAQFEIASIFEVEKGDPAGAIERFRKVAANPWKAQADQRVAVMEAKALKVVTPRAFRSGETAQLKITSRNLENLTFTAYKLNAEAYFRKKHLLGDVESLDIGLVAPDAEWTVPVPGYAKFKPVESSYDLKVAVPGVYVVKVTDEKTLQATALVVGSDLDAIVKASREQVLVFAQDRKTGQGRKGARVLIADGSGVILEKTTGDDGVLLSGWDKPLEAQAPNAPPGGRQLEYLVLDGGDAAGSGLVEPSKVSQGLTPRAYIYTDRPAYRPGQEVALRGVIREAKDGQYANPAGEPYKLEVYDSRGRLLIARNTKLSEFGTFHESLRIDSGAPVGSYRVRVFKPGQQDFSGAFQVQSYKLEKIDLDFDFPRTVYYRGETIKGSVVAKYQYGAPLASRPIELTLPDGRTIRGMTDAAGKFPVEFPTEGFAEEQALRIVARLPGDNVGAVAALMLAIKGFRIDLNTSRTVYLDGETFALSVSTSDAQGKPTGQDLRVSVLKQVNQDGRITEREVSKQTLTTDKTTGKGNVSIKVEDEAGGGYVIRVTGTDQFTNPIVADRSVEISGKADETRLRIFTDRPSFKVGETASVNLHARGKAGTALLAWEADRILKYQIVPIREGDNPLTWPVDGPQFPNFTLTASRMAGEKFDVAALDVRVERDLRLTIKPLKSVVKPGEEVEVEVSAVDQLDRPVAAEVALALIDRSLLRQFAENLPPIGPYFYNQTRTGAFTTEASNTFKDEPETMPVSDAVVEEAERLAAQTRNEASRGEVMDAAKSLAENKMPQGLTTFAAPSGIARMAVPMAPRVPGDPAPTDQPMDQANQITLGAQGVPLGGFEPGGGRAFTGALRESKDKVGIMDDDLPASGPELSKAGEGTARKKASLPAERRAGRRMFAPEVEQPREQFAETAYWNPSVVTGKDGKATVKFKAPMALSEYTFSARGVTGADSLVGQSGSSLTVKKDFFVDLKAPATLTQGDKPRFSAEIHHVGIKGNVDVRLSIYSGEREQVYPKTLDLKGDGVEEILFEPFDVPEGESVRLTLTAKAGEVSDELVLEVPIRPWGVQAFASASGTSSNDATAFVGLPPGRAYESPEMRIDVSPTLRRLLIEIALRRDFLPYSSKRVVMPCPIMPNTLADRASDLLAATSALNYLNEVRTPEATEAVRLSERIQGLVAELITSQNDDGGWPWVGGFDVSKRPSSDRMTSALVASALASARSVGLLADPTVSDRATNYLTREFTRAGNDYEGRAALLYALAGFDKASFEQANSLNRIRQSLPDVALAHLALTLAKIDRASLANEVLDVLVPRAKSESAGVGQKPRKYWEGKDQSPFHRGLVETTALVALAIAKVRPQSPDLEASCEWLLAHRLGNGWLPNKAKGSALAALTAFYGKSGLADDRYRLVVTVNDVEVSRTEVVGSPEGKSIVVPRKAIKLGDGNRVRFQIEGRGTFGYAVSLTGFARDLAPEQKRAGKPATIDDRSYLPAAPEFDGKPLPTGFSVAVNPTIFTNKITQLSQGGRAKVRISPGYQTVAGRPSGREFLVVEETLPAGSTLIDGSVQTSAGSFTLSDNVLTFYFSPEQGLGAIEYEVSGYLPGRYRALPTRIFAAYDPGQVHLGQGGDLQVLAPGEKSTDAYKSTPDELFARGRALFQAGKLAEAAGPLEELFGGYGLNDATAREASRMLLTIHIKDYQPRKVVQDFEILREKGPDLVIPFDEVQVVGRAYRDIGEFERAFLVFRAIVEASYLEDAQVGETLRQRGRTLEATAYLIDLWRESPNTPSIESDFFGLSQILAGAAPRANTDPILRAELAEAGVTRSQLLLQAIRMIQVVLSQSPKNPLVDEASLALLGAYLELEDFESVVRLAPRFARLYPKSSFLDSFQYSEALGQFSLGQYDRAIEVARAIASATYKDANGIDQPSPNKWQALYILGQIHDARKQPAQAVEFYKQVADRFADAAGAVKALTRKDLKLPEVSIVRPSGVAPADVEKPGVKLDYRNIADVDVKVYPVDLMRLYLTRRNLDEIAGIDLAGITPTVEQAVKLGDGADFDDKNKGIELPLSKEGAYLVMARGENLYASGIVLVTPLELEVLEEPESGRVRVVVRDSKTKNPVPKVQVKVIGTNNPTFFTGQTDLRGVYVAEGVNGQVTAVARKGSAQYAFYRGKTMVGVQANLPGQQAGQGKSAGGMKADESLDNNLKIQNESNQNRQLERLQNRYQQKTQGVNPF